MVCFTLLGSPHISGSTVPPSQADLSRRQTSHVCVLVKSLYPYEWIHRLICEQSESGTACWPCRQRKVKCDNKQPCENCVKREHAQLCSYKPNRSAKSTAGSDGTGHVSKKRTLSIDDQDHGSRELSNDPKAEPVMRAFGIPLRPGRRDTDRPLDAAEEPDLTLISVDPESAEVTRYLGQNSIPALLREQSSSNNQPEGVEHIRQDMRSILGLDNSAPFPLMSSRHLEKLTADISAELPSDREVYKYVCHCFPTLLFTPARQLTAMSSVAHANPCFC